MQLVGPRRGLDVDLCRYKSLGDVLDRSAGVTAWRLHDFRRTAITGMQMAGVSEKECSMIVGDTPEVIRKHYEKLDRMTIAKRSIERRLWASNCTIFTAPAPRDAKNDLTSDMLPTQNIAT